MTYKVGDQVFDFPSNRPAAIVEIYPLFPNDAERDDLCFVLDNSVPLNPTNDGAYPTRSRIRYEICPLGFEADYRHLWNY